VIGWKKQGDALVGVLTLPSGRPARIVLMGPRSNPKGAMVVIPSVTDAKPEVLPLADAAELLSAQQIIDVACVQERIYGDTGLTPPDLAP
jgi:hypothetical protein